jgi:WD40 repeat protein
MQKQTKDNFNFLQLVNYINKEVKYKLPRDILNLIGIYAEQRYIVLGSSNGISVLNIRNGQYVMTRAIDHKRIITCMAMAPGQKAVIFATGELWAYMIKDIYQSANDDKSPPFYQKLSGHTDAVHAVAVTPDGKFAITGSRDGFIKYWNTNTGECEKTFDGCTGLIYAMTMTPDGKYLITGNFIGRLAVYTFETGMYKGSLKAHEGAVETIICSPDGKKVISSTSYDYEVIVWDITNIEESCWNPVAETYEHLLMGGLQIMRHLAMSYDGTRVFGVSQDGSCGYWSLPSRKYTQLVRGESPFLKGMTAISKDCSMIVFKPYNAPANLVYIDTGDEVNLPIHNGDIYMYFTS